VERQKAGWVLYVEGARDREILNGWARRISPHFARDLSLATVILGGRQPARAAAHLEGLRRSRGTGAGLCLLDRDGFDHPPGMGCVGDLETFTWSRRHIESYLLVPPAIRRGLRLGERERSFSRVLERELPAQGDTEMLRKVDAKAILGPKGHIARWLGRPLQLGRIAHGMRADELPDEVHALLRRLEVALDWAD